MIIVKNLYQPPKIMKYEKDQYPQSTYELDGYTSYSWKRNIPKYDTEIDKHKLSMCWNNYRGSVVIEITDNTVFDTLYVEGEDPYVKVEEDNENNTITFTGNTGSYIVSGTYTNEDNEAEQFEYIFTIYPNQINKITFKGKDYINSEDRKCLILDQFNTSSNKQVILEDDEYTPHHHYYEGISYNYSREHQP